MSTYYDLLPPLEISDLNTKKNSNDDLYIEFDDPAKDYYAILHAEDEEVIGCTLTSGDGGDQLESCREFFDGFGCSLVEMIGDDDDDPAVAVMDYDHSKTCVVVHYHNAITQPDHLDRQIGQYINLDKLQAIMDANPLYEITHYEDISEIAFAERYVLHVWIKVPCVLNKGEYACYASS